MCSCPVCSFRWMFYYLNFLILFCELVILWLLSCICRRENVDLWLLSSCLENSIISLYGCFGCLAGFLAGFLASFLAIILRKFFIFEECLSLWLLWLLSSANFLIRGMFVFMAALFFEMLRLMVLLLVVSFKDVGWC